MVWYDTNQNPTDIGMGTGMMVAPSVEYEVAHYLSPSSTGVCNAFVPTTGPTRVPIAHF
jgi:hypothetical protein